MVHSKHRHRFIFTNILLLFAASSSALAQPAPAVRHDHCINGIVSFPKGPNGRLEACGEILQTDPKLAGQLEQVTQLLLHQQSQLTKLTKSVNAVGSNLDLTKQVEMLQTLVAKLSSNPDSATLRAGHLADSLDSVQTQIITLRSSPKDSTVLESKLKGSLGDAIAQLDTAEATTELNDLRAELNKIDVTTSQTAKDVRDLRTAIDSQLHPERLLPPEEGKLYTQTSPLMMELAQLSSQWSTVDLNEYRQHPTRMVTSPAASTNSYADELQKLWAPILSDYQKNVLPELNAWRGEISSRVPAINSLPVFEPVTEETGMMRAGTNLRLVLQQYIAGDPHPSSDLARQGHELQAKVANIADKMRQTRASADTVQFQQRSASVPRPNYQVAMPGSTYVEGADGPVRKEFLEDLEPRLMAWQTGVKKFFPDFKVTDFSKVSTSLDLRNTQINFNQQVMRVNSLLAEQMRSATP